MCSPQIRIVSLVVIVASNLTFECKAMWCGLPDIGLGFTRTQLLLGVRKKSVGLRTNLKEIELQDMQFSCDDNSAEKSLSSTSSDKQKR